MKIKYSWFDFNLIDILGIFVGKIVYIFYRFIITIFLKKHTVINFEKIKITINGLFMKKEIYYDDIKFISIRKNFLNSYDLVINLDETITFFKYTCNYITDAFSSSKDKKNTFVICEIKNINEIIKDLLEKMEFNYDDFNNAEKSTIYSDKVHKKYSFSKSKNYKSKEIIKISDGNNSIYVIDNFVESDKSIILDCPPNKMLYQILYRPMPLKYNKKLN